MKILLCFLFISFISSSYATTVFVWPNEFNENLTCANAGQWGWEWTGDPPADSCVLEQNVGIVLNDPTSHSNFTSCLTLSGWEFPLLPLHVVFDSVSFMIGFAGTNVRLARLNVYTTIGVLTATGLNETPININVTSQEWEVRNYTLTTAPVNSTIFENLFATIQIYAENDTATLSCMALVLTYGTNTSTTAATATTSTATSAAATTTTTSSASSSTSSTSSSTSSTATSSGVVHISTGTRVSTTTSAASTSTGSAVTTASNGSNSGQVSVFTLLVCLFLVNLFM